MKILIDNGHGKETPGKCSPDGRLLEYRYARLIAKGIVDSLKERGHDAELLVPEENDVALKVRAERANRIARQHGKEQTVLISIHVNAAGGDGKWHDASGWSGWVASKSSQATRLLATTLLAEAKRRGLCGNRSIPAQGYWTADFYILRATVCPAVLTENLFQDCRKDVDYLLSDAGKKGIIGLHTDAIEKYIKSASVNIKRKEK